MALLDEDPRKPLTSDQKMKKKGVVVGGALPCNSRLLHISMIISATDYKPWKILQILSCELQEQKFCKLVNE
ncbi:unnamed protein product [Sphenostylis stenocarpa]|uniref:Uncharacterized protein n=1 Tax=Sphenostylis stenocarpa TaxID=92480 RepID=A0AA86RMA6_9FABA|nr:unnamed protein product [Sphenostylis stenocarpa]